MLELFSPFRTKNKLNSHKKVKICNENKDSCSAEMPSEETKILELNQYQKYDKAPLLSMQILNV